MKINELIERYEDESGNTVKDSKVYDSCGRYICKFTKTLAKNYHENLEENLDAIEEDICDKTYRE